MIYPEVELNEWVEKWGLIIQDWNCHACHKDFKTTVPIMTKDSAGVQTPIHECGVNVYTVILTPRTAEALAFWNTIV